MKAFLCVLLVWLCLPMQAEEKETIKKKYTTNRVGTYGITIDGKISEEEWGSVEWGGGDFIVRQPNEGDEASEKTLFKLLYDDTNFYIAARCMDAEPQKIVRRMSRRDRFEGDWVEFNIDSYFDKQTAFSFTITAAGVLGDEFISENGNNWDASWDPVWYAKTQINDEGWTAELRIPLSQLRFSDKQEQVWGMQVTRRLFRKNERSNWQFIPQNSTGWVHLFGEVHGIKNLQPQRQMELVPYAVSKALYLPTEAGNPFTTTSDLNLTGGMDGKVGLTSDLTLNFTVNPDFGQVEADPSEVNLSAFESFFSERRPFFVEGRNILNYQVTDAAWGGNYSRDNLFYSRRIGRSPSHYPEVDGFVNVPINTSILGAMKVTGKTRNGWSIGLLESITAEEKADIDSSGIRDTQVVEPLTNYFAGRLEKDINKGNTIIGGMVTAVNRKIDQDHLNFLRSSAYSGGINLRQNFKDRQYYLDGNTIFSHIRGDQLAIYNAQRASARYFQRPGASHLVVDSTRTSMSGHGGSLKFGKNGNFRFQSGVTWRSPGLELNDLGFQQRADEINEWSWANYSVTKPFAIFNTMRINGNTNSSWDFSGENLSNLVNTNGNIQFRNQWWIGGSVTYEFAGRSKNALRGGPLLNLSPEVSFSSWINSDQRKKLQFETGTWQQWGGENSTRMWETWLWISYQPSEALSFTVNPYYFQRRDDLQYIDTGDFAGNDRYVFGTIMQKTASITLRMNYSLTPDLSIEYYGSPFISAGNYHDFKRITDPDAGKFRDRFALFQGPQVSYNADDEEFAVDENSDGQSDYTFGDPDFNFRAFNSNLVVRWQFQPGSTLFFVWSQGRSGNGADGRLRLDRDFRGLFEETDSSDILLLKVSRWFSL